MLQPEGREITLFDRGLPRPLGLSSGLDARDEDADTAIRNGVQACESGRRNPAPIPAALHVRNRESPIREAERGGGDGLSQRHNLHSSATPPQAKESGHGGSRSRKVI